MFSTIFILLLSYLISTVIFYRVEDVPYSFENLLKMWVTIGLATTVVAYFGHLLLAFGIVAAGLVYLCKDADDLIDGPMLPFRKGTFRNFKKLYNSEYTRWNTARMQHKPHLYFQSQCERYLYPEVDPAWHPLMDTFVQSFIENAPALRHYEQEELDPKDFTTPVPEARMVGILKRTTNFAHLSEVASTAAETQGEIDKLVRDLVPVFRTLPKPQSQDAFLSLSTPDEENEIARFYSQLLVVVAPKIIHPYDTVYTGLNDFIIKRIRVNIDQNYGDVSLLSAYFYERQYQVFKTLVRYHEENTPKADLETVTEPLGKLLDADRKPVAFEEIVHVLFNRTGFEQFTKTFSTGVTVPDSARFEHMWVVAPHGEGKTTFLSNLILKDLPRVALGEASVVVMDVKNELVSELERSKFFGKGEILEGKLVSIDVNDVEFPVALSITDFGVSEEGLSPRDKVVLRQETRTMFDYFFQSLLGRGSELTDRQSTVFTFIVSLLQEIPNANLETILELCESRFPDKYMQYVKKLPPQSQKFFHERFNNPQQTRIKGTKSEIADRMFSIINKTETLAKMFSAPKTKLNLYDELGKGKVIVINAAGAVLGQETEVFGRFFIAMMYLAAQRRQLLDKANRIDTYFYIDEAHNFIANDTMLPKMLAEIRAYRMGLILCHQNVHQLSPQVAKALEDCNIKAYSNGDYSFLVTSRRYGSGNFVPENWTFDKYPHMSDADYLAMKNENRRKYCFVPKPAEVFQLVAEEQDDYDPTAGDDDFVE